MKYLFHRDTIFATIGVFLLIGLFSLFHFNTHIFDPIQKALHDFDFNDLSYAKMGKAAANGEDEHITVVNIGNADRGTLALLIQKLHNYQPRAIGMDAVFDVQNKSEYDSLLTAVISQTPELVIGERISEAGQQLQMEGMFANSGNSGYVNLGGEEEGVIRSFQPTTTVGGTLHHCFAAKICEVAYADKAAAFLKRKKNEEIINYSRTADKYFTVSYQDILEGRVAPDRLRGKIILLGYIGSPQDVEDRKFTPMNEKYVGKSLPDMPGVIVHANIISMLLEGNYVHQIPTWLSTVIAFVFTWLGMAFFIKFYLDTHIWFHLKSKVVQLLLTVLFVYIGLYFFHYFDTKLNLSLTLLGIVLAVDVLYFYEAFAKWMNKKFHFKTLFTSSHH